jgi:hypothetical protein
MVFGSILATIPKQPSPKLLLLVVLLVPVAIPLTWKAKSLEKRSFGHSDKSQLMNKQTRRIVTVMDCAAGPRPLTFLRDILAVAFWRTDTVQTHFRIVAPRLFVIPKLDAFEGTFAEEVDDVVPSPG